DNSRLNSMIKIFSKTEDGISEASWRGKFYGFIKEGHKERVAPQSLKIAAIAVAVVASAIQLLNMFQPNLRKAIDEKIGLPELRSGADQHLNIPLYDTKLIGNGSDSSKRGKLVVVD